MTDRVYELIAKPGIISKKIRQIDIQIWEVRRLFFTGKQYGSRRCEKNETIHSLCKRTAILADSCGR